MEKRYQVFVSSTYADLRAERADVVQMLLSLDALPAGMELFPATNDDAWTLIQRIIDESDYYLLIVGGRYGSMDDATDLSYTEREFDYAIARNKPVMAFVHSQPGDIPSGKTDQSDAGREKLDAFRQKVMDCVHVKFWSGGAELAGLVAAGFTKLQKSHPAVGWVRGDQGTSTESLEEINSLRRRLEEAQAQVLATRQGPPPGTEQFAQGSDELKLDVLVTGTVQTDDEYVFSTRYRIGVPVSWDALFAAIGPALIDEASQPTIKRKLKDWISPTAQQRLTDIGRFGDERMPAISASWHSTEVDDAAFDTVLLQLDTLALITRSERKRSLKDVGTTYWTLTPYGQKKVQSLRAIRRDQK